MRGPIAAQGHWLLRKSLTRCRGHPARHCDAWSFSQVDQTVLSHCRKNSIDRSACLAVHERSSRRSSNRFEARTDHLLAVKDEA
jgi:hypothetical protein